MPRLLLILAFLPLTSVQAETVPTEPVTCHLTLGHGNGVATCEGLPDIAIETENTLVQMAPELDGADVLIENVAQADDVFADYVFEDYPGATLSVHKPAQGRLENGVQLIGYGYYPDYSTAEPRAPRHHKCRVKKSGYYKKGHVVRCE